MEHARCTTTIREPWNKGKLVGQKAPFKLKEIWAIRVEIGPVLGPITAGKNAACTPPRLKHGAQLTTKLTLRWSHATALLRVRGLCPLVPGTRR